MMGFIDRSRPLVRDCIQNQLPLNFGLPDYEMNDGLNSSDLSNEDDSEMSESSKNRLISDDYSNPASSSFDSES